MRQTMQIQKLHDKAILPTRGSAQAAGMDLYACLDEDLVLAPGTCQRVPTGLSIALPEGTFGGIYARSGLAAKEGLRPANCVGVVDSDYRGEWLVPLYNDSAVPRTVRHGDRVAQLIVQPYLAPAVELAETLSATERGQGGFGSTGK